VHPGSSDLRSASGVSLGADRGLLLAVVYARDPGGAFLNHKNQWPAGSNSLNTDRPTVAPAFRWSAQSTPVALQINRVIPSRPPKQKGTLSGRPFSGSGMAHSLCVRLGMKGTAGACLREVYSRSEGMSRSPVSRLYPPESERGRRCIKHRPSPMSSPIGVTARLNAATPH
jgi:hypothetical protein